MALQKEGDKVEMKLVHESEVNTARYCPQHAKLIATKPGQSSDVLLFDVDTHPFNPTHLERERGCKPNFRLKVWWREYRNVRLCVVPNQP